MKKALKQLSGSFIAILLFMAAFFLCAGAVSSGLGFSSMSMNNYAMNGPDASCCVMGPIQQAHADFQNIVLLDAQRLFFLAAFAIFVLINGMRFRRADIQSSSDISILSYLRKAPLIEVPRGYLARAFCRGILHSRLYEGVFILS